MNPSASCEAEWLPTFDGPPGIGPEGASAGVLAVFDDGGGPALYVAGSFFSAGGAPMNAIAKWDGSSWSGVGGGVEGYVSA